MLKELATEFKYICGVGGQAEIKKMTGRQHRHWPTDRQLDQHILAYMWCKFEAYLCRNNRPKNLNMAMAWVGGQVKIKN